jgi:hypothetical protein
MDDEQSATWADALLRRPAIDPSIPGRDRDLLLAPGTVLTPAGQGRPARSRDYLPAHSEKREATVYGAVTGMTTAAFVAVGGATPWAIGVLIFQGPAGWQSASGRYALLLAEVIAAVTAVVFGARIVRFGQLSGRQPAAAAARAYHGRYLTSDDFDARTRVLLRRAQDAVDAVASSLVCRAGLLDEQAGSAALAAQEWEIALALHEQARLRRKRAELPEISDGTAAAELLERQRDAARLADQSIADRVAALERYAAEVREADEAYRDWRQYAAVAELSDRHLDMLARTAADVHGVAEIEAMSQQARAVRLALRELLD